MTPAAMPLDAAAGTYRPGMPAYRPYRRLSDLRQTKGEGLARQEGEGEDSDPAIAERLGKPLGPAMIDTGLSAYKGAHLLKGELGAYFLEASRGRHRGDVLGIDEWSRLTRLPLSEGKNLLNDLNRWGVGIYVKKSRTLISEEEIDGEMGVMRYMEAIFQLQFAHTDSASKSRYTRKTIAIRHRQSRQEGVVRTKLVPGWCWVEGGTFKEHVGSATKRKCHRTEQGVYLLGRVNEAGEYEPGRIIREIKTMGIVAIAEGLNGDWLAGDARCAPFGVNRKNGSAGWYPATISNLLKDRRLVGELTRTTTSRTGEKSRLSGEDATYAPYPAMLDQRTFDEVRGVIAGRRSIDPDKLGRKAGKGGRKGAKMPNLFTGLLRCKCGSTLTLYTSRPGRKKDGTFRHKQEVYTYLQCRAARIGTGCRRRATLGRLHHAFADVERGDLGALLRQPPRGPAGAGGEVEDAFSGLHVQAVQQVLDAVRDALADLVVLGPAGAPSRGGLLVVRLDRHRSLPRCPRGLAPRCCDRRRSGERTATAACRRTCTPAAQITRKPE